MFKSILLIHPLGYDPERASRDVARLANLMPPLGLCSIAAYLEQHGLRADIIDCFAHPDSDEKIRSFVREQKPDFVGFTCTTNGFLDAVRLIALCKEEQPEIRAVVGGPHVSALKESILETQASIDYAVIGEGERPLLQLMTANEDAVAGIPGMVYRDGSAICFTGFQDTTMELDDLPLPAYEKLDGYPDAYQLPIFNYPSYPNASCISSRGCPYTCSYCDRSVFRRSFRYNSAGYVWRHMKHLREKWNIRHINFYDDQFTLNRERIKELCERLIERAAGHDIQLRGPRGTR